MTGRRDPLELLAAMEVALAADQAALRVFVARLAPLDRQWLHDVLHLRADIASVELDCGSCDG